MNQIAPPILSPRELEDYLYQVFPELLDGTARPYTVTALGTGTATLAMTVSAHHQRPGGTVSGPAMMALADLALYAVILAHIGKQPLAVTTSLNFNFLRKPELGDLAADVKLLKLGRRLAVGEIDIRSQNAEKGVAIVAHATGTYSIPPRG